MNSVFRLSFFASLLAIVSCAPSITRPTEDKYSLQVVDNAQEQRFDLVLKSHDTKPICVSIESWPSVTGKFPTENDTVTLETAQGMSPVASELQSAYCPGGCGVHRVEPQGELRGFINFQSFGDPERIAADFREPILLPSKERVKLSWHSIFSVLS